MKKTNRTNSEWVSALRGDLGDAELRLAYQDLGEYIFRRVRSLMMSYKAKPALRNHSPQQLDAMAEEFTQDLLEKVFEKQLVNRYREKKNIKFTSYILTIATRYLYQVMRRKKYDLSNQPIEGAMPEDDESSSFFQTASKEPGPENSLEQQEVWEAVRQCIEDLPAQQRKAFLLKFGEGLSSLQIRDKLDKPSKQAVFNLINRARTALKQCLNMAGWLTGDILKIFALQLR